MTDYEKKVYTLEDNVKCISFSIKAVVKEFEELNLTLSQLLQMVSKKEDDENEIPF